MEDIIHITCFTKQTDKLAGDNYEKNHHESVWKIGSRWSENGDINRKIFCLFKESHCVFFGDNQNHTTSHINTYKDKIKTALSNQIN